MKGILVRSNLPSVDEASKVKLGTEMFLVPPSLSLPWRQESLLGLFRATCDTLGGELKESVPHRE